MKIFVYFLLTTWMQRRIQKVLSEGVQLWQVFERGETIQANTTVSGPSSAHQQNAIYFAFPWRADNGSKLNAGLIGSIVVFQGIRTSIAKRPYILVICQGGSGPPIPALDPPMMDELARIINWKIPF